MEPLTTVRQTSDRCSALLVRTFHPHQLPLSARDFSPKWLLWHHPRKVTISQLIKLTMSQLISQLIEGQISSRAVQWGGILSRDSPSLLSRDSLSLRQGRCSAIRLQNRASQHVRRGERQDSAAPRVSAGRSRGRPRGRPRGSGRPRGRVSRRSERHATTSNVM